MNRASKVFTDIRSGFSRGLQSAKSLAAKVPSLARNTLSSINEGVSSIKDISDKGMTVYNKAKQAGLKVNPAIDQAVSQGSKYVSKLSEQNEAAQRIGKAVLN